jgi:outer membrane protein assembly factor BamD (BamD/ComL family)
MKISKQRILQIIKEEAEDQFKRLSTKGVTATKYRQAGIDRAQASAETTPQERGIVNQIEQFISNLANTEGVDLVQYKALLERILKYLQKSLAGSVKPEAGEQQ